MRGTPSFRGSIAGATLEGAHSITSYFSITDSSHKSLFSIHPTSGTCSVNFNELSPDVFNHLKKCKE